MKIDNLPGAHPADFTYAVDVRSYAVSLVEDDLLDGDRQSSGYYALQMGAIFGSCTVLAALRQTSNTAGDVRPYTHTDVAYEELVGGKYGKIIDATARTGQALLLACDVSPAVAYGPGSRLVKAGAGLTLADLDRRDMLVSAIEPDAVADAMQVIIRSQIPDQHGKRTIKRGGH